MTVLKSKRLTPMRTIKKYKKIVKKSPKFSSSNCTEVLGRACYTYSTSLQLEIRWKAGVAPFKPRLCLPWPSCRVLKGCSETMASLKFCTLTFTYPHRFLIFFSQPYDLLYANRSAWLQPRNRLGKIHEARVSSTRKTKIT